MHQCNFRVLKWRNKLNFALLGLFLACANIYADEDSKEITRRSYNITAREYQKNNLKMQPGVKAQEFLHFLSPNSQILDLGCGPGRDARFFVERGFQVVGVDISDNMIELACNSVPEATFLVGDIEEIDFASESFNGIWASASLIHVSKGKMPIVLEKLYHILKPGGIFYVSMKMGSGEGITPDERYGGVEKFWNYVSESELLDLLTTQNFQILHTNIHEKSTSYQTHSWLSVICSKPLPVEKI